MEKDPISSNVIVSKSKSSFTTNIDITPIYNNQVFMCRLPGVQSKVNPEPKRLTSEVMEIKDKGITGIVCLLSRKEMKGEGVSLEEYSALCKANNIDFFHYEIKSMKAPADPPERFNKDLIEPIMKKLSKGESITVHCKNGVGRAGTVVSCLLIKLGFLGGQVPEIIAYIRKTRSPRCLQSLDQECFVEMFAKYSKKNTNEASTSGILQ